MKAHYGIDIQLIHSIDGGADANALVYKADANSNSYFVKVKSDNDDVNLSIIRLLHDSGIKEIIFPIANLEGKLFLQLDSFTIIVYPFVEAPNGFNQDLTKNQWIQLGKALRKIHDTAVPNSIQQQLKKETYTSKWREMVKSFYNQIEPNASDDEIKKNFKSFFQNKIDIILRLVDSSEKLAKTIRPDVNKYVLCHSDIHAGNVLVSSQESIYIIDWDQPMIACKERDLMFIGGGVGNVWNRSQEISSFYEGYGKTEINKTLLSYYRHERIIEDIALFGQDLLSHYQTDKSRLEMFMHFKGMFDSNGVIDIAFGTFKVGSSAIFTL